jgi:hypothetical protein
MTCLFFDVEFHEPNAASNTDGGWIIPTVFRQISAGHARISPHFENLDQLEWQIDQMKADLEEIREIARRRFATINGNASVGQTGCTGGVQQERAVRGRNNLPKLLSFIVATKIFARSIVKNTFPSFHRARIRALK